MAIEVENDPFFQLLTDALRAGPASPPWREAVAKLRDSGGEGTDEYRLLIEARQNLEVGKEYRQVRPGPEFTRKVLTGVDETRQSSGGRRLPIAGIVAILAAIVLIGVVAYVARMLIQGPAAGEAIDDLAGTYFSTTAASEDFNTPIGGDFRLIGGLKLATTKGLHLPDGDKSASGMLGGGVVWSQPLPADEPFAIEAHVRAGGNLTIDQLAEIFVSNSPDFSADRATAPHELVWLIQGVLHQVVRDGEVVYSHTIAPSQDTWVYDVHIVLNKDLAVVEVDHHRLWAGPIALGDSPRYVGVRILTTAPGVVGRKVEPAILDWKILTK